MSKEPEFKNDEEKLRYHEEQARVIRMKGKWLGKGGIWSTFRNIGKDFYNDKSLDTATKRARLKKAVETFVSERL